MTTVEKLKKLKEEHEQAIAPYINGRARHTDKAGRDDTTDYVNRHVDAIRRIDKSVHDIETGKPAVTPSRTHIIVSRYGSVPSAQ